VAFAQAGSGSDATTVLSSRGLYSLLAFAVAAIALALWRARKDRWRTYGGGGWHGGRFVSVGDGGRWAGGFRGTTDGQTFSWERSGGEALTPRQFLDEVSSSALVTAIRKAEERSQAEIRVHVSTGSPTDLTAAARSRFEALGMARTRAGTAVLLYLVPARRELALVVDAGIQARCGSAFWPEVANVIRAEFVAGRYTEGLALGVSRASELIGREFPQRSDDRNELPDDISQD
jgi:hypothetical protein